MAKYDIAIVKVEHINKTAKPPYTFANQVLHVPDHLRRKKAFFKDLCVKYGKCISKVYEDMTTTDETTKDNPPVAVGWVFEREDDYKDTGEKFTHEVWITLLSKYQPAIFKTQRLRDTK
jgi:hypothetical protein